LAAADSKNILEISMQIGSSSFRRLPAVALTALLSLSAASAGAQQRAAVSPPGDTVPTAGPLAHLSPKLSRRDLAKAMKLVADWQLNRLPAKAQYDWTWAALYTGFLAIPDKIAGDKYERALMNVSERLDWQPGPRVMHADDQAIGQTYLELYTIHQDHKMIEPLMARLNKEMATPDPADPRRPLWWWCDALFMAPPVYAQMYTATGDIR
jgi:unsaturated rhamnogalacturonyl hydrolase